MRRLLVGIVIVMAAGCAADSTAPQQGKVVYSIDAQTCVGSAAFTFYIDGKAVGTETLSAGTSSQPYTTAAGQHTLGANDLGDGYTWPSQSVTVPVNNTFTWVLKCA